MDPRGTVGSIYKGEYYTLVHTTYESSGSYGFGEDFFYVFPMMPPGRGRMDPGAWLAGFIAGFIKRTTILLHTKYEALGLVVSEKKIA